MICAACLFTIDTTIYFLCRDEQKIKEFYHYGFKNLRFQATNYICDGTSLPEALHALITRY